MVLFQTQHTGQTEYDTDYLRGNVKAGTFTGDVSKHHLALSLWKHLGNPSQIKDAQVRKAAVPSLGKIPCMKKQHQTRKMAQMFDIRIHMSRCACDTGMSACAVTWCLVIASKCLPQSFTLLFKTGSLPEPELAHLDKLLAMERKLSLRVTFPKTLASTESI